MRLSQPADKEKGTTQLIRAILVLLAAAILLFQVPWAETFVLLDFSKDYLGTHPLIASIYFAGTLLALAAIIGRKPRKPEQPSLKPINYGVIVVAGTIVATAASGLAYWLLALANSSQANGPALASLQIDAIRTALAGAGGVGAGIALMLAFRRQRSTEIATQYSNHDATEKRITDLYDRAVDKLQSSDYSVRLGGLQSLDRLARDNPIMRQTVLDALCSYVRLPCTQTAVNRPADMAQPTRKKSQRRGLVKPPGKRIKRPDEEVWQEALRLIERQCNRGGSLDINLSNVELDSLVLVACDLGDVNLAGTTIYGKLSLRFCVLSGNLKLSGLVCDDCDLERISITEWVEMESATVKNTLSLRRAGINSLNLQKSEVGSLDLSNCYLIPDFAIRLLRWDSINRSLTLEVCRFLNLHRRKQRAIPAAIGDAFEVTDVRIEATLDLCGLQAFTPMAMRGLTTGSVKVDSKTTLSLNDSDFDELKTALAGNACANVRVSGREPMFFPLAIFDLADPRKSN